VKDQESTVPDPDEPETEEPEWDEPINEADRKAAIARHPSNWKMPEGV
jgi:hypothetical protein